MTELINSRSNKHVSIQLDFNFENIELVGYETFLELEMKFLDVLEETLKRLEAILLWVLF